MGVGVQRHARTALLPRKRPGTNYAGGWVGWTGAENLACTGIQPRTVQSEAGRSTDDAILAR